MAYDTEIVPAQEAFHADTRITSPTPNRWIEVNASSPAKKLCARGPVRVDCYEYAVGQGAVGIWGGRGMGQRSRSTAITDDVIPSTACPVR